MRSPRKRKSNTDLAGDLAYAEITLDDARFLARMIAIRAGMPGPEVRFSGKSRRKMVACYDPHKNEIVLHANAETVGDLCHELAHGVMFHKGRRGAPHGPDFRRVFWKIRERVLPSVDPRAVKAGTLIRKDGLLRVRSRFSVERLETLKQGPGGRWNGGLRAWLFPPESLLWLLDHLPELYPHPSVTSEGDETI